MSGLTAGTRKAMRYPATRAAVPGVAQGDTKGMCMFGTPVMRSAFSGAETSNDKKHFISTSPHPTLKQTSRLQTKLGTGPHARLCLGRAAGAGGTETSGFPFQRLIHSLHVFPYS